MQKLEVGATQMKFHILPEGSHAVLDTMGTVTVDKFAVQQKMDEYFRDVIAIRLEDINADEAIKKQMERRIEIAAKKAFEAVEREMIGVVRAALKKRITEMTSEMPIEINVKVGEST